MLKVAQAYVYLQYSHDATWIYVLYYIARVQMYYLYSEALVI